MKDNYRRVCVALAWGTIITQYILLVASKEYGSVLPSTGIYLGYFTIWSNILVALAFSVPFLNPTSKLRIFFERPAIRAAIALYILIVAIVYYALLAKIHHPVGLGVITNIGLHFLLPVLYILDWLIFAGKRGLQYKHLPLWIIFPLAYGGFNIIRGMLTGFYPYPFLDVSTRGAMSVTIVMLVFAAVYYVGGGVFIWVGKRIIANKPQGLS